jgi:aminopeptidase N
MKINCTQLLLLFAFIFIQKTIIAQPEDFHGCHYHKSQIPMIPLTESEIIAMTESAERSDTIDILNYNITIDATDFSGQTIKGSCEITFTPKMDGLTKMQPLDLLELQVDSIEGFGGLVDFDFDGLFINFDFPQTMNIGDTSTIKIYYQGHPIPASGGFGGFVFEGAIAYNLGIGLGESPYNFGRGWFPCFDNFVERATYDLNIISPDGKRAYGIGTFLGETDLGNGSNLRQYRFNQPLPTYLVGVAIGPYAIVHDTHTGTFGDIPVELIGHPNDTSQIKNSFEQLGNTIDALEYWFGPYHWDRVGYVMTNVGAMEHCTNIAYPVSIATNGPTPGQNRLAAHELAHHWWGNMLTLSSPANMWIKEGNAEYGAHLMTEYTFGQEYFVDVVKDNHLNNVLVSAHVDDGAFLPLSGIPYQNTYGTHTYRKGASMMHNLRGYLGDDKFRSGMSAMLQHFKYQSINAEDFRDYLSDETGVDLNPFFDAWIYNPGYSNFEINEISVNQSGGNYNVEVEIQQKLRAAPAFHEQVPLEITFFDENWNEYTEAFVADGEFTMVDFTVPFEPKMQVLNDGNKLNLARMQNRIKVNEPKTISTAYVAFLTIEVLEMAEEDSAMINIVHHWTAPDSDVDANPFDLQMSSTHYWNFSGVVPENNFKMKGTVQYKGGNPNQLDHDLTQNTEDSLILVWRENPDDIWIEYPYYRKQTLGSTDGSGFIRIDTLLLGDYAFANGEFPVATNEVDELIDLTVYPNPTDGVLYVEGRLKEIEEEAQIEIYDLTGKLIYTDKIQSNDRFINQYFDLGNLSGGSYFVKFRGADGDEFAKPQKVMIF